MQPLDDAMQLSSEPTHSVTIRYSLPVLTAAS